MATSESTPTANALPLPLRPASLAVLNDACCQLDQLLYIAGQQPGNGDNDLALRGLTIRMRQLVDVVGGAIEDLYLQHTDESGPGEVRFVPLHAAQIVRGMELEPFPMNDAKFRARMDSNAALT